LEYIERLLSDYPLETAEAILQVGNAPGITMGRMRPTSQVVPLPTSEAIQKAATSPEYYIQNITPATLISHLSSAIDPPNHILDLCASPGGKLIHVHDLFQKAFLYANDINEGKLKVLKENLNKYQIEATFTQGKGETYSKTRTFDLIILDVPCSNSGVFNKRPEARWRLSKETLQDLEQKQFALLEHAVQLLASKGQIWYLTCSILKCENESFVNKACETFGLVVVTQQTILPNLEGWDGGFGCSLTKS
jgi:16S rRNA (cytosine967-C5)-methyltransferase